MYYKSKRAFTLIELLVAIAIIGLLVTISVLSLQNARAKSRDAKRVADMKQVSTALEMFFNDNNRYPTIEEWNTGKIYSTTTGVTSTYMQVIPNAPTPADGSCKNSQNAISYIPSSDGSSYSISFCLGGNTGTLASGPKCLTPGGILDIDCSGSGASEFVCGGQIIVSNLAGHTCNMGSPDYDSCIYNTVQIGTQCWMSENMNIGVIVDGTADQVDNGILEKYCYDPDGNLSDYTYCQSGGGIYQWNEAMQYSISESAQGICPDGWHIPTDIEQDVLDQYLTDSPNICDYSRAGTWSYCANAGTKLKISGSSNFNAPLSGNRDLSGLFYGQGSYAYFWSSTISGVDAWHRNLSLDYPTVDRNHDGQSYGFSVRCIQD